MQAHDDTSGNLDWILPSQAAYVVMRWGSCYGDGDGTGASFFVYPSVGLSFGDKLAGLAINTPATAVRSLGGYTIQAHTVNERPGTAGVDPSPWNDLHDGLGFDLTPYSDQLVRAAPPRTCLVLPTCPMTPPHFISPNSRLCRLRRSTAVLQSCSCLGAAGGEMQCCLKLAPLPVTCGSDVDVVTWSRGHVVTWSRGHVVTR